MKTSSSDDGNGRAGSAGPLAKGEPSTKSGDWAIYRRLLGYVADHKRWFLVAAVGFAFAAGGEVGFAWVFGRVVDALSDPKLHYVWMFPLAMLALAVPRALGTVAGEYALSKVALHAIHVIRRQLFDKLLFLPSAFYDKSAQGALVNRMTFTAGQLRDTTTDSLKVLVADGLKVMAYLGAMFYINWLLTLTFAVVGWLVGVIVRFASKRFRRLSTRIQDSMGDVTHVASEAVSGYREVKIFGGEGYERQRFLAASEQNRRLNLKMAATKASSAQLIQLLAAAALSALVCLVFVPLGEEMSPGTLATYLGIAGALANPIKKLSDVNARLQRGLAAAEDIFAQLDQPPEQDAGELDVDRVAGELRFENVSFAYGDRPAVLRDVSLTIAPGQTVALVGRSGAGKTTLASLIARFYVPTSGRILLDGKPLQSYRLSCLRRQIALVTQNVTLFNDTLANNIAYGGLADASAEHVQEAVRRAQAQAFVDELPQRLDTVVGDDGVLLSGGQRQRVAIARALLKDAPILILDEATSSLDAVSEKQVQAALEEVMHGRTTVVIAHRLSTIERADVIAVVEDGSVVETGDHQSLMAAGGAYAELYRSQFEEAGSDAAAAAPVLQPTPIPAAALSPLVRAWYDARLWPWLLMPAAALFAWFARRRRRRFLQGRSRCWQAPVPVVVVGNVTVGGTGKTPLVVWLARWLAERGVRPGVVSRGYGGKADYPLPVAATTPASECGDEAALIARRCRCPVVVDPNRVRAVQTLLATCEVDVVIADDGLQHYALGRSVEVAVIDGFRGVGNGLCLPAGPLREPVERLLDCDWVVANGIRTGLAEGESVMTAQATAFVNVATGERLAVADFAASRRPIAAVAGIGNPRRFEATLASIGIKTPVRAFPDHHRFSLADLDVAAGTTLVVTEKDAEKIRALGTVRHCWYLEIDMRFLEPVDERLRDILRKGGVVFGNDDAALARDAAASVHAAASDAA